MPDERSAAAPPPPPPPSDLPVSTVRRLRSDLELFRAARRPHIALRPSEANFLEWHFVLHSLPSDTPYHGGCYHGRIVFQPEYPLSPPSILMCTPSGRLQTGQRFCVTETCAAEAWKPELPVHTVLDDLLSFFLAQHVREEVTVEESEASRRTLAEASWRVNASDPEFCELFPEFASGGEGQRAREAALALWERGTSAPVARAASSTGGAMMPYTGAAGTAPAAASSSSSGRGPAPAPAGDDQSEEPAECWICRDSSSTEPLMRPCACRGSMSGVHATCVEQWIHHHQRRSSSTESPRCPVCHQQYKGDLRRPGLGLFVWQMCRRAAGVVQQFALWVILCNGFVLAVCSPCSETHSLAAKIPLSVRVAIAAVFVVALAYTLAVLTVSLPPLEAPPQNPLMQRLFVSHRFRLVKHIADAVIALSILTDQYASGNLQLSVFLSFVAAAAVPYSKCLWKVAGIRRSRLGRGHQVFHCCWLAAACIPMLAIRMLPSDWRRAVHPLGAGPHIAAAVGVVLLCSCCPSVAPVLVLWALHSTLMAAGLLEVLGVRKLRWQRGMRWAVAVWLALCAALYANNVGVPPGSSVAGLGTSGGERLELMVCCLSLGWLCLVLGLAVAVNWNMCVRIYRIWQRRHANFALQPPAQDQVPSARTAVPTSPGGEYVALPDGP